MKLHLYLVLLLITPQAAVVPADELVQILSAAEATYHNFNNIPPEAFPLFLPAKTYLRMMDGTIETPYFPRRLNGAIMQVRRGCWPALEQIFLKTSCLTTRSNTSRLFVVKKCSNACGKIHHLD